MIYYWDKPYKFFDNNIGLPKFLHMPPLVWGTGGLEWIAVGPGAEASQQ